MLLKFEKQCCYWCLNCIVFSNKKKPFLVISVFSFVISWELLSSLKFEYSENPTSHLKTTEINHSLCGFLGASYLSMKR